MAWHHNDSRLFFSSELSRDLNEEKNLYVEEHIYRPLYRNYFGLKGVEPNKNLPDLPWRETWNGVRRAMRKLDTPDAIIREYCLWAGIRASALLPLLDEPTNLVVPFFSALKTKIHLSIDSLPAQSRYWIDLVYLAGYPRMEHREAVDDPVLWLSSPTQSEYSALWWDDQFDRTFAESISKSPLRIPSLREFALSRWLWVTDGATSASKLLLGGDRVRTKFGAAASLTDEEILDALEYRAERDDIGIFLKPDEAGYKRRLIANVPLGSYIVASYIRHILELFVGKTPKFMKLGVSQHDCLDVLSLLREHRLAMPLDESAYDYHVSRESWLGFLAFLERQFPENEGVDFFRKYFHSANWRDPLSGSSGKWLSGMPSGLALTSYLNSWMNFIKQTTVVPGDLAWAAGDDVLTFPYKYTTLEVVEEGYAKFGSSVNSMKNWMSIKYAEYLKVLYYAKGTTGYPARIWGTLMWAGATRTFLPADRLVELAELFKQFFDRLGVRMTDPKVEKYICADLSRSVSQKVRGFNTETCLLWLHSPRANGGFGCLPYNDYIFDWKTRVLKRNEYVNAILRLPPILTYDTKVELNVKRSPARERDFNLGNPYILPPIETLEQWESRINREDITVKGKYSTMVLDIIPIPTLDFVSTANVSSFASFWGYNVFPNIRGRHEKINDRLISASINLATNILRWMSNNSMTSYC